LLRLLAYGQLKGSTYSDLYQFKDLRRNPNCSLLIIDFSDSFRTLEVRVGIRKLCQRQLRRVRRLPVAFDTSDLLLAGLIEGTDPSRSGHRRPRRCWKANEARMLGRPRRELAKSHVFERHSVQRLRETCPDHSPDLVDMQ